MSMEHRWIASSTRCLQGLPSGQNPHRKTRLQVAACALLVILTGSVRAANQIKANTTAMNTAADWGGTLPGPLDSGTFNNVLSAVNYPLVSLGGNVSFGSLVFANNMSAALIVAPGSTLTLNTNAVGLDLSAANNNVYLGCAVALGASQTWDTASTRTLVLSNVLSGGFSLTKQGSGTLTFYATNSFTGGLILSAGTLYAQRAGSLGAGPFTINAGTFGKVADGVPVTHTNALTCNGGFTVYPGNSITLSGPVTLNSNVNITNTGGNLFVTGSISGAWSLAKYGTGQVLLNGSNSFSGGLTQAAGTLFLNHNHAVGTGALTITGGSLNGQYATVVLANNPQNWNADFTFVGSANLHLGAGPISLGGNRMVTVTANTLTVGGVISGGFSLTKAGPGTLLLTNANAFTGSVTNNAGVLKLAASGSFNAAPAIVVAGGATNDVAAVAGGFVLPGGQSLYGGGVLVGNVATASGARIYPGFDGSAATLTFQNDLNMTDGGACYFDLNTSTNGGNDKLIISGSLLLNTNTAYLKALGGAANLDTSGDYVLATAGAPIAGAFSTNVIWIGTPPANATNFSLLVSGNQVLLHSASNALPPTVTATATPTTLSVTQSTFLTATAAPGSNAISTVTVDASAIGGSASVSLVPDGAGHHTNTLTVAPGTQAGTRMLTVTATDTAGLTGTCQLSLTILPTGTITLGSRTTDSRGVVHLPVTSSFQGNSVNDWRIILPSSPTNQPRQFLYLLPVDGESTATTSAGAGAGQYGDNVEEALRVSLADRYNAIVVCPTFTQVPWYANHPTDPAIQQESYLLQAIPAIEALYPQPIWTNGHPHRTLAGFSKSGWGACSLGVRHPGLFDGVVPWDAPMWDATVSGSGGWLTYGLAGNTAIFGTSSNYWYYQIDANITNNAPALRDGINRFGLLNKVGYDSPTRDTPHVHSVLDAFSIPNTYSLRPNYLHRWYSGWVDDAARFLNQGFLALPPALAWTGGGSGNLWSTAANWSPGTNSVSGGMISFDNTDSVGTHGAVTSEVSSSLTVGSLLFANSSSSHTLQIDSGVSLVVTGSYNGNTLEVGQVNGYYVTDASITGGGLLRLDNTNADFKVRAETAGGVLATPIGGELDMSGLARFEANVRDVLVGAPSGFNTRGDVTLAASNAITAGRVLVGALLETSSYLNLLSGSSLNLGPTNFINADTVCIGYQRSGWGTLRFATNLSNPQCILRGTAGGSSRADMTVGYGNPTAQLGNGTNDYGLADLSAGSLTLRIDSLLIGSTRSDNVTGAVRLGSGTVDVTSITIGQVRSGSASGMTATASLTNSAAIINAGTVTLSDSPVSGCTANGTLTLNGGALLFSVLQKGASTGSGTAALNLNGGLLAGNDATSRTVNVPITLQGSVTFGQLSGGTGALSLGGPVSLAGSVVLAADVPVSVATGISQTGSGRSLAKTGAATSHPFWREHLHRVHHRQQWHARP